MEDLKERYANHPTNDINVAVRRLPTQLCRFEGLNTFNQKAQYVVKHRDLVNFVQ